MSYHHGNSEHYFFDFVEQFSQCIKLQHSYTKVQSNDNFVMMRMVSVIYQLFANDNTIVKCSILVFCLDTKSLQCNRTINVFVQPLYQFLFTLFGIFEKLFSLRMFNFFGMRIIQ